MILASQILKMTFNVHGNFKQSNAAYDIEISCTEI